MRCPQRFVEFTTDRTVMECPPDCALLVEIGTKGNYGDERSVLACGLVAKGRPRNTIEVPKEGR